MTEFPSDYTQFVRRTRRRLVIEISVFLIVAWAFSTDWTNSISTPAKAITLLVLGVYILIGVYGSIRSGSNFRNYSIHLLEKGIGFTEKGEFKIVPYTDFKVSKIVRTNDGISEIQLKTLFGQCIKISSLEDMETLYRELSGHDCGSEDRR